VPDFFLTYMSGLKPDLVRNDCSFVSRRTPIAASFWVGSLHEFVGWFQGRVPLDHLPSANSTIGAAAVGNGQFGIADEVLRSAVPTDEVTRIRGCWGAHWGDIYALVIQRASRNSRNGFWGLVEPREGPLLR
jgi:hypothetical protein